MIVKRTLSACVLTGLLTSGIAQAADSGFYFGASLGQARQSAEEFEGSDTSYKLFGGWSLNKYFAFEGGYVDGGTQSDTLGLVKADISSDGLFVAGLVKWPLGDVVAPYAKLGHVFYDTTATLSTGAGRISESDSATDLLYGIGCEFKLGDSFGLRAEYERVNVSDSDFDIASIVATYRF